MKWWIVAAIWLLWCTIIIDSSRALKPKYNYSTTTYTTHDATHVGYRFFINSLRKYLASKATNNDIPVLPEESQVEANRRFVLVELATGKVNVTLALYAVNAYIVAFKVDNGRSFFFKGAPRNYLFEGTTKTEINVEATYCKLGDRNEINLGIEPLKNALHQFTKFNPKKKLDDFCKSLVILAQMVSEAARFKLVQNYIEQKFEEGFKPGRDVVAYENKWEQLSQQIQQSENGKFRKSIKLKDRNGNARQVTEVDQVKDDMGLLLALRNPRERPGKSNFWNISAGDLLDQCLPNKLY